MIQSSSPEEGSENCEAIGSDEGVPANGGGYVVIEAWPEDAEGSGVSPVGFAHPEKKAKMSSNAKPITNVIISVVLILLILFSFLQRLLRLRFSFRPTLLRFALSVCNAATYLRSFAHG